MIYELTEVEQIDKIIELEQSLGRRILGLLREYEKGCILPGQFFDAVVSEGNLYDRMISKFNR